MNIPPKILARLEAHRAALLRNGDIEHRRGKRGITYRIRFRTMKRRKPGWCSWKLPDEAVAQEVAALVRKWRREDHERRLGEQTASDNYKRLVAYYREEIEWALASLPLSEGRKRATRRSFREAARKGLAGLHGFLFGPLVTPPKKPGRPRRRRLGLLTPLDFEQPTRPTILKPAKPRSGLSVYFAPAKTSK